MPVVVRFPAVLRRHVACAPMQAAGGTVRAVLDDAFARRPDLRGYVLDDRGALRPHMTVFVDGRAVTDRRSLGDAVGPASEVEVFQALSGG